MTAGDKIRVRGKGGVETTIVLGDIIDERTLKALVESGEWTIVDDKPSRRARKGTEQAGE